MTHPPPLRVPSPPSEPKTVSFGPLLTQCVGDTFNNSTGAPGKQRRRIRRQRQASSRQCARRAREGADFEPLRLAVDELGTWFPQHAQSMDAGLAQHMASLGFDTRSGQFTTPLAADLATAGMTGCGSVSCS